MKYFSSQWEQLTSDKNILDIVEHCHFEFVDNKPPIQENFSQGKFNDKQSKYIDEEVKTLLQEKVIAPVEFHSQQFLSPIF